MTFSLSSLDSAEFEYLCKDLAEKETGIKLTCYTAGCDGGIDADDFYSDNNNRPQVIVQAKHWERNSSFSKLTSALKNLIDQLAHLASAGLTLMLFTSMELTRARQESLQTVANNKGFSKFQVFDKVKICELLDEPKNVEIVRKNFKLWIAHTEVLNHLLNHDIFIDCGIFFSNAQLQSRLFVQTTLYDNALESLNTNRIVLIVGDPGTGKTTLTKMLALNAAACGYAIRYSDSNNAQEIKKSISDNPDFRELVILDDFLGQRCLDISQRQMAGVLTLITLVRQHGNKQLILNSRFSILNEAKSTSDDFYRMIQSIDNQICIVNSDRLTMLDKAQIFLSNMIYYNVPTEYIANISKPFNNQNANWISRKTHGYEAIVNHQNYNPRIIEYICRKEVYSNSDAQEYTNLILDCLEHPTRIWRNEFDYRLSNDDRNLMYVLFSLTNNTVSAANLNRAFSKFLYADTNADTSRDIFEESLNRLTDALIRKTIVDGEVYLSVANPSINDYIFSFLSQSDAQAASIIDSAEYSDQLDNVAKCNQSRLVERALIRYFIEHNVSDIPSLFGSTESKCLSALSWAPIANNDIADNIITAFNNFAPSFPSCSGCERYIAAIYNDDLIELMPSLSSLFTNPIEFQKLIVKFDIETVSICHALSNGIVETQKDRDEIELIVKTILLDKIGDDARMYIDDALPQCAQDNADTYLQYDKYNDCYMENESGIDSLRDSCFDSIAASFSDWCDNLFSALNEVDMFIFPNCTLEEMFLKALVRAISNEDFSWLFESANSSTSINTSKPESNDQIAVNRLFAEYVEK